VKGGVGKVRHGGFPQGRVRRVGVLQTGGWKRRLSGVYERGNIGGGEEGRCKERRERREMGRMKG